MNISINNKKIKIYGFWGAQGVKKKEDFKKKDLIKKIDNVIESNLINNLEIIQKINRCHKLHKPIKCLICGEEHVDTCYFKVKNLYWLDGIGHYIQKHNIFPGSDFINFILNFVEKKSILFRNFGKHKFKLTSNQLNIFDALMEHGKKKNAYKKKNRFKYSEHAGMIDFNRKGLETILVDANTTRIDVGDSEIFLPNNRKDVKDYEYIFHTHPPTPHIGARISQGILYEFPSANDLNYFLYYTIHGSVQGSIINTPEGLYIIKLIDPKKKDSNYFNR